MNDDNFRSTLSIVGILAFIGFVTLYFYWLGGRNIRQDAVKANAAHYELVDAATGKVEFKWGPKP